MATSKLFVTCVTSLLTFVNHEEAGSDIDFIPADSDLTVLRPHANFGVD